MWRHREELAALDIDVLLISFEPLERLRLYRVDEEFGWPVVSDESRAVYAQYGLERASFTRVWLSPRTVWYYLKAVAAGKRLRPPVSDTRQLGGDFLIDPAGRIAFAFRSSQPADRPPVSQILEARESGP